MSIATSLLAPIAPGELIDKITILRLKAEKLQRPTALENVRRELKALEMIQETALPDPRLTPLTEALQDVNRRLWDVEDALRLLEAEHNFGPEFIELARSVYKFNDERAAIKRLINVAYNSPIVEDKSYGEPGESRD